MHRINPELQVTHLFCRLTTGPLLLLIPLHTSQSSCSSKTQLGKSTLEDLISVSGI